MPIEPLESRIAPAGAINATTATFIDVDGDLVTIKFSKPIAQQVLYSTTFGAPSITGAEQLLRIDLFNVTPAAAEGVNITITAVPRDGNGDGLKDGDGKVNVGELRANGLHLGTVSIRGDLGQINAGNASATVPAVKTLTVDSWGEYGLATGASSLLSNLAGPVGSLIVKGNVRDVTIGVVGLGGATLPLGSLFIGGSLVGGDTSRSGYLECGAIGSVKIGGNLEGGLAGSTGMLKVSGKITSLTIGGSVLGLHGDISGAVQAGALGNVSIGGDVHGDDAGGFLTSAGAIGNVTIGGSLIGTDIGGGVIRAGGDIGTVKIGGDVQGGTGGLTGAGRIEAGGKMASVTIGGSLVGFAGNLSGSIYSLGRLGPVTIGGSVLGHDGEFSGSIRSETRIDSVKIGGSLLGGAGVNSGAIYAAGAEIGTVAITRDVIGYGERSGVIATDGPLTSIVIGGSLIGGFDNTPFDGTFEANSSGRIDAGALGSVKIGGDLVGHARASGVVLATTIGKAEIGGSILGGELSFSGFVQAVQSIGSVKVGGDVISGYDENTGFISAGLGSTVGNIGSVSIGGSLRSEFHGSEDSVAFVFASGTLGSVNIGGSVLGGYLDRSGFIEGRLGIGSVTIGGSLIGLSGVESGVITTGGTLGTVKIGGDIRGGDSDGDGATNTGAILAKRITSLTVVGSIYSGIKDGSETLVRSGAITADEDIGTLTIQGSLIGNDTHPVVITAGGRAPIAPTIARPEPGIGAITIGGRVDHTFILAGYNKNGIGVSADATVGAVKVGGDWIGSYLSAGVEPGADLIFGTTDDKLLPAGANFGGGPVRDNLSVSKIASIVIGGQIKSALNSGLPFDGNQTYGFVAQQIGSFKYDDIVVPLKAGASNDIFALGKARPLGASRSTLNTDGFAMHVFEV